MGGSRYQSSTFSAVRRITPQIERSQASGRKDCPVQPGAGFGAERQKGHWVVSQKGRDAQGAAI